MQGRSESLKAVTQQEFDLAVIGGGITGAAVAQNAARRGLSVVLIEKGDFASGASSKTGKLIDGGFHCIEGRQWRRARELCRESALLESLAPQLVRDINLILPHLQRNGIAGGKRRPVWMAELGLIAYDLLGGNFRTAKWHHHLSEKDVAGSIPSLAGEGIRGGMQFHAGMTDDVRLTLELLKSACASGAVALNYLAAQSFVLENGRISKIICRDRYEGRDIEISCRGCVSAAGVWTDAIMQSVDGTWGRRMPVVRSTHIVLPNSVFETNSAALLPLGAGHYMYVVPWQKAILVGSTMATVGTETAPGAAPGTLPGRLSAGNYDSSIASENEIAGLLNLINRYVRPDRQLGRHDVIASWAGFRIAERSLFDGPAGVVCVVGVGLNGFQSTAGKVVDRVLSRLPSYETAALKPAMTEKTMLGGWLNKEDYLTSSAEISARARRLAVEPGTIDHLCQTYGKDALRILDIVESDSWLNKRICPDFPPIMAEIAFTVKHEMAMSVEDALFRRVRLGHVNQRQCLAAAAKIARLIQGMVGWDEVRTAAELKFVTETLEEHLHVEAARVETA